MKIYVGNLSRATTEIDLRRTFESFGQVESVSIVHRKPRGFGFVNMPDPAQARAALNQRTPRERGWSIVPARPNETQGDFGDCAR